MVTFNRRFRSTSKGYSRERVKRDTEFVLEQELDARGLRDVIDDDRGVAGLVFGSPENRLDFEEPEIDAAWADHDEGGRAPIEITEPASPPRPGRRSRIVTWFRALFHRS